MEFHSTDKSDIGVSIDMCSPKETCSPKDICSPKEMCSWVGFNNDILVGVMATKRNKNLNLSTCPFFFFKW